MSTTRPRQPDSNDDRYIGQTTYYGYDNQRLNRPQYYHYLKVVLDAASTVDQTITEYTLRYNTSYPGYWISSPQKGEQHPIVYRVLLKYHYSNLLILNRNNVKFKL